MNYLNFMQQKVLAVWELTANTYKLKSVKLSTDSKFAKYGQYKVQHAVFNENC